MLPILDTTNSSALESVYLYTVDETNPSITLTAGRDFDTITSFTHATKSEHLGTTKYQLSNDGTNWYWHDGTGWVAASGYAESNTVADVSANVATLHSDVGGGTFHFKIFLSTENDTGLIRLDNVSINGTKNKTK